MWDPLCIFATVEGSNFKFGTQLGFGTSLAKNNVLDQNWRGLGQGSIQKKLGPLCIFATVETSNLKFGTQLGFGTSLPKNNVLDQNWRGCGTGASKKNWDPLHIFANVEASNFKFGTQILFGTSLPEKDVQDQNWRGWGGEPGEHLKKICDPLFISATYKLATEKLVHNMSSGLPCQTQVLFRQGLS